MRGREKLEIKRSVIQIKLCKTRHLKNVRKLMCFEQAVSALMCDFPCRNLFRLRGIDIGRGESVKKRKFGKENKRLGYQRICMVPFW